MTAADAGAETEREMTVDELARRAGLTVRNLRNYQARGLIDPPRLQGRVGYYGASHLSRLQLIRELQERGFNLTAIAHLLERASGAGEPALGFTRSLIAPFETEPHQTLTRRELNRRWGGQLDDARLRQAERLGLVRPIGRGTFEAPSPTLLRAGEQLVALGVPLKRALQQMSLLGQQTEQIAQSFVGMFLEFIWDPFDRSGRPEPDWPRIQAALDQLRPLATEAVTAAFQQTMTRSVEAEFDRHVKRREAAGRHTAG